MITSKPNENFHRCVNWRGQTRLFPGQTIRGTKCIYRGISDSEDCKSFLWLSIYLCRYD